MKDKPHSPGSSDSPHSLETRRNESRESKQETILLDNLGLLGESRRSFLKQIAGTGLSILMVQELISQNAFPVFAAGQERSTIPALENAVKVSFEVNGAIKDLTVDPRMTLLDALRERLSLTGSKKGCDHGQCGACTVIVEGRRVLSCLTLAATCEGKKVTTIEGLAKGEDLHPMQAAFVKHDGFQCGYCTPGQICSAVALLNEAQNGEVSYVTSDVRQLPRPVKLSDDEIKERMSGNICRCGAYPNIVDAIKEAHSGKDVAQTWQFTGENEQALFEQASENWEVTRNEAF
jgi:xanthine dehydrogenase YagT iron-sulfur-binding subunit